MNLHRSIAVLLLVLGISATAAPFEARAASPPEPQREIVRRHLFPAADAGQVLSWSEDMEVVPLTELERLVQERHRRALEQVEKLETERRGALDRLPVPYLVREAAVEARVAPGDVWCLATLRATVDVTGATETLVPVASGGVVLGAARVDGQPARVVPVEPGQESNLSMAQHAVQIDVQIQQAMPLQGQAGSGGRLLQVVVRGAGRHRLEVDFASRVVEDGFYSVTKFGLPGLPSPRLALSVPGKEVHASIQPPCKVAVRPGEAPRTAWLEALLPPSPDVELRWVEVVETPAPQAAPGEAATTAPLGPPRLDASVVQVYDAGETGLSGQFHALVRVRLAPAAQLECAVPTGVQVVTLEEPRNWTLEDPGPPGKARKVRLLMPEKLQGDASLRLDYAVATPAGGFELDLPALELSGVARQGGFVAVTRSANLQLACTAAAGVEAVALADLPAWAQQPLAGELPLFLYRRTDPKLPVRLSGKRLADAAVLVALVDAANAWTTLDASGQIVGRLACRLRSSGREWLDLDLGGFEQTGLFLDGKTPGLSPAPGGKGVRVSLAATRPGQPSTLEVRFRGAVAPLETAGTTVLTLPALDVPIRELTWQIYTPRGFAFTDARGTGGLRTGTHFRQDLLAPPDPVWPGMPIGFGSLGVASGERPTVRAEYLAAPLYVYPLLMLFLFGGLLGYLAKRVLLDGRGYGTAALGTGLAIVLFLSYYPVLPETGSALFAGFMLFLILTAVTTLGRWAGSRMGARPPAPPPPAPPPPPPAAPTQEGGEARVA